MKRTLQVALLLPLLLSLAATAGAQHGTHVVDTGPDEHISFRTGDIDWQDGPGSLEPGARFAILEGDPGAAGVFTMRLYLPDGFHIAPHWHPNVERVTVISGTFMLGHGETLDRTAAEAFGPGSYVSMPPGMRHFAIAVGDTVVQLTSLGPWVINYVAEVDDPRLRN
jgi:quercetin dioxygenase-like cupin family protein